MTQDHSSKLSFSIEESVWLNKGQEVDEIVSLSLDPDITVAESGDYVLIRGGLKLTGEYRSNLNSNPTGDVTSLSEQVGFRSIEEVTLNEDGTGEIRHYFPIDVTIPQERINSLEDIYVLVESFDYDLPERGCIQLTADVAITGMTMGKVKAKIPSTFKENTTHEQLEERSFHYEAYSETEPMLDTNPENTEKSDEVVERVGIDELDELENHIDREVPADPVDLAQLGSQGDSAYLDNSVRREESAAVKGQEDQLVRELERETVPTASDEQTSTIPNEVSNVQARAELQQEKLKNEIDKKVKHSEEQENVEDVMEVAEVKIPSVAFGVIKDRPKQEIATIEMEEANQNQDQSYGMLKGLAEKRLQTEQQKANQDTKHDNYQGTSQPPENGLKKYVRAEVGVVEVPLQDNSTEVESAVEENENALYLTKMLTKDEDEFKKLKMCIIQEDESLEIIATKYEVNQSALIRVNRLNGTDVEAGQILYIPG